MLHQRREVEIASEQRGNLSVAGLPLLDEDIDVIVHVRFLERGMYVVFVANNNFVGE